MNNATPLRDQRIDINEHSSSTLVAETYHSTIELGQFVGRMAIIKRCRNQDDPRTLPRFRNEAKLLQLLAAHDHITQLWDADITQLTLTLRVERGQSLDKYVDDQRKSTLSASDSNMLWGQMSSALAYLHANSIIHDDIKPENIMWDLKTQHGVLIDFGAALNHKELPADWFNPSGTPPYAPPEFLHRKKGSAGDVWALGVTMLFAFQYVKLPDGGWILPHTFEDEVVLEEMKSWLSEIEGWRKELANGHHGLIGDMLEQNPSQRIIAAELEQRLNTQSIQNKN